MFHDYMSCNLITWYVGTWHGTAGAHAYMYMYLNTCGNIHGSVVVVIACSVLEVVLMMSSGKWCDVTYYI